MNVWVEVHGDGGADGASLFMWVRKDPAVMHAGVVPTESVRAPETLSVVVANGIALGRVVTTISNWRASRIVHYYATPAVTVRRGDVAVAIESNAPDDLRESVATLLSCGLGREPRESAITDRAAISVMAIVESKLNPLCSTAISPASGHRSFHCYPRSSRYRRWAGGISKPWSSSRRSWFPPGPLTVIPPRLRRAALEAGFDSRGADLERG